MKILHSSLKILKIRKVINGYLTFPTRTTNATELNCKVVKNVTTTPSPYLHQPPFSGLSPLSGKRFCPHQILEGPALPV